MIREIPLDEVMFVLYLVPPFAELNVLMLPLQQETLPRAWFSSTRLAPAGIGIRTDARPPPFALKPPVAASKILALAETVTWKVDEAAKAGAASNVIVAAIMAKRITAPSRAGRRAYGRNV